MQMPRSLSLLTNSDVNDEIVLFFRKMNELFMRINPT